METFPSSPPAAARADLTALRTSLDLSGYPTRDPRPHVLIATWNLRGFGRVLESLPRTIFRPSLQGPLSNVELSWRISDHYALWASFSVRPAT